MKAKSKSNKKSKQQSIDYSAHCRKWGAAYIYIQTVKILCSCFCNVNRYLTYCTCVKYSSRFLQRGKVTTKDTQSLLSGQSFNLTNICDTFCQQAEYFFSPKFFDIKKEKLCYVSFLLSHHTLSSSLILIKICGRNKKKSPIRQLSIGPFLLTLSEQRHIYWKENFC